MADPLIKDLRRQANLGDTPAPDPFLRGDYIRTYAKDVAHITGKPVAGPVKVAKSQISPPKKIQTLEEELTPDSGGRLAEYREERQTARGEAERALPSTTEEERAGILARLKKQVLPQEEPVVPGPTRVSLVPEAPVSPSPFPSRPVEAPSPIHTYKTDFADHIDAKGASTFSVLAAQADAGQSTSRPPLSLPRPSPILIVAILFVVTGITGIFFAIQFATGKPPVPIDPVVPSLIFADEKRELTGSGADLMLTLKEAGNVPLQNGGVLVTYLATASTSPAGPFSVPLPGRELILALTLGAPDILLRNIEPESTVGIVVANGDSYPFFIMKVSSYERTFAGMLAWESSMDEDLKVLYPPHPENDFSLPTSIPLVSVSSTTGMGTTSASIATTSNTVVGTSTDIVDMPILVPKPQPRGFVDRIVANHDVRMYLDYRGETRFLYGYKDKQTLIVARNEAAFAELIDRLSVSR